MQYTINFHLYFERLCTSESRCNLKKLYQSLSIYGSYDLIMQTICISIHFLNFKNPNPKKNKIKY